VRDLDAPDFRRAHHSEVLAVDHNQYIVDNGHIFESSDEHFRGFTFQANYESGLRVLNIDDIANERGNALSEVAFFDVYPWKYDGNGSAVFEDIKFFGAWSVYPFFGALGTAPSDKVFSQKVVVQSTTTGLYVLEFNGDMDFSERQTQSDGDDAFEWNSELGMGIIAGVAVLAVAMVICVLYRVRKKNSKKRVGVYESIIAMPDQDGNHSNYGTPGNSMDKKYATGPDNRM